MHKSIEWPIFFIFILKCLESENKQISVSSRFHTTDFIFNHNYNKILESDWLSAATEDEPENYDKESHQSVSIKPEESCRNAK